MRNKKKITYKKKYLCIYGGSWCKTYKFCIRTENAPLTQWSSYQLVRFLKKSV